MLSKVFYCNTYQISPYFKAVVLIKQNLQYFFDNSKTIALASIMSALRSIRRHFGLGHCKHIFLKHCNQEISLTQFSKRNVESARPHAGYSPILSAHISRLSVAFAILKTTVKISLSISHNGLQFFVRTHRNALTVETRKLLLSLFRNKRTPPSRNGNEIGKTDYSYAAQLVQSNFILNLMTSDIRVCT